MTTNYGAASLVSKLVNSKSVTNLHTHNSESWDGPYYISINVIGLNLPKSIFKPNSVYTVRLQCTMFVCLSVCVQAFLSL